MFLLRHLWLQKQQGLHSRTCASVAIPRSLEDLAHAFGGRGRNLLFLTDSCPCPRQSPLRVRPRPHFRPDSGHVL